MAAKDAEQSGEAADRPVRLADKQDAGDDKLYIAKCGCGEPSVGTTGKCAWTIYFGTCINTGQQPLPHEERRRLILAAMGLS
jgi:hypothetical protein